MTVCSITNSIGAGRYRFGSARWPHVGEGTATGMRALDLIKQCDGSRVSAAGEAR